MKKTTTSSIALAMAIFATTGAFAQDDNDVNSIISKFNAATFQADETNDDLAPLAASFVEMGKPSGGYNVITDMAVFNGRLYLATSNNPLGGNGTSVFYTTNGTAYTGVLSSGSSQGYLKLGVYDNQLWIPDGDPIGLDPSYAFISSTGDAGSFTTTTILGAVHSFQIIKYNNKMLVSNGMASGQGGLCKFNGTNQWNQVYSTTSAFRMKTSVEFQGKLLVATSTSGGDTDYIIWNGDVETTQPSIKNAVTGSSYTFRWFASSIGKLYWSVTAGGKIFSLVSTDGNTWAAAPVIGGKFVSDYCELNGRMYALAQDGLWESSADHSTFTKIASVPVAKAFDPYDPSGGINYNVEAQASMEVYNGAIWCGSSTNGKVYKVDVPLSTNKMHDQKIDNIYPNPFTSSTSFHTSKEMNNATMVVYNALGEEVKNVKNIYGHTFTFERGELPAGIYSIQIKEENTALASEKLIIAD